jgi:nicotinate-nucleotide pyrophosphorylase (carboxylating)
LKLAVYEIDEVVERALAEDLGGGDPTTDALIAPDLLGRATVVAREEGVLAGVEVAAAVWRRVDPAVDVNVLLPDGSALRPHHGGAGAEGDAIAVLEGPVASILKGERTALNFLQRMSGIATEAARYVEAVAGYDARILDTRKTVPGLRALDKYAVRVGGGTNHRRNLADGVLIKDNHIAAMRGSGLTLRDTVERARAAAPHTLKIEVEVEDLGDVGEALEAGANILLLDNMSIDQMVEAASMARGRALTEASGGISLRNVGAVAATGVDLISVGALTHSVRALDIGLDLV